MKIRTILILSAVLILSAPFLYAASTNPGSGSNNAVMMDCYPGPCDANTDPTLSGCKCPSQTSPLFYADYTCRPCPENMTFDKWSATPSNGIYQGICKCLPGYIPSGNTCKTCAEIYPNTVPHPGSTRRRCSTEAKPIYSLISKDCEPCSAGKIFNSWQNMADNDCMMQGVCGDCPSNTPIPIIVDGVTTCTTCNNLFSGTSYTGNKCWCPNNNPRWVTYSYQDDQCSPCELANQVADTSTQHSDPNDPLDLLRYRSCKCDAGYFLINQECKDCMTKYPNTIKHELGSKYCRCATEASPVYNAGTNSCGTCPTGRKFSEWVQSATYPYLMQGECNNCDGGYVFYNNECKLCSELFGANSEYDTVHKCCKCKDGTPHWKNSTDKCVSACVAPARQDMATSWTHGSSVGSGSSIIWLYHQGCSCKTDYISTGTSWWPNNPSGCHTCTELYSSATEKDGNACRCKTTASPIFSGPGGSGNGTCMVCPDGREWASWSANNNNGSSYNPVFKSSYLMQGVCGDCPAGKIDVNGDCLTCPQIFNDDNTEVDPSNAGRCRCKASNNSTTTYWNSSTKKCQTNCIDTDRMTKSTGWSHATTSTNGSIQLYHQGCSCNTTYPFSCSVSGTNGCCKCTELYPDGATTMDTDGGGNKACRCPSTANPLYQPTMTTKCQPCPSGFSSWTNRNQAGSSDPAYSASYLMQGNCNDCVVPTPFKNSAGQCVSCNTLFGMSNLEYIATGTGAGHCRCKNTTNGGYWNGTACVASCPNTGQAMATSWTKTNPLKSVEIPSKTVELYHNNCSCDATNEYVLYNNTCQKCSVIFTNSMYSNSSTCKCPITAPYWNDSECTNCPDGMTSGGASASVPGTPSLSYDKCKCDSTHFTCTESGTTWTYNANGTSCCSCGDLYNGTSTVTTGNGAPYCRCGSSAQLPPGPSSPYTQSYYWSSYCKECSSQGTGKIHAGWGAVGVSHAKLQQAECDCPTPTCSSGSLNCWYQNGSNCVNCTGTKPRYCYTISQKCWCNGASKADVAQCSDSPSSCENCGYGTKKISPPCPPETLAGSCATHCQCMAGVGYNTFDPSHSNSCYCSVTGCFADGSCKVGYECSGKPPTYCSDRLATIKSEMVSAGLILTDYSLPSY